MARCAAIFFSSAIRKQRITSNYNTIEFVFLPMNNNHHLKIIIIENDFSSNDLKIIVNRQNPTVVMR